MQTIHSWKLTHTFARFMIVVLVASLLAIVSVHPSVAKAASASDCSLGNPCISATNLDCAAIDGSPCVSVQSNLTIFDNRSVTFVFKIPSTSLRTYPTAQYHVYWLEACSLICSLTPASAGNFTSTLNYWNTTLLGGEVEGVVVETCDIFDSNCSPLSSPAIIDTGYTPQQQSDTQAQCLPTIQHVSGNLLSGTYSISKCTVDAISNLSTTLGSLNTVWQDIVSLFPKITAILKKACPFCGLVIDIVATYISYTLKQFQTFTQSCDPAYFDITAAFIVTNIRCSQYAW